MERSAVLLLSPLSKGSGNNSTIQRIRTYLEKDGHYTCMLQDPECFGEQDIENFMSQHGINIVIALHAYRSGRLLSDCGIPFILILGGTDINEYYREGNKLKTMSKAVKTARYIVAFSETMADRARELWPQLNEQKSKLIQIRQAVITNPSSFSILSYLRENTCVDSTENLNIFVVVGSIRPVKNPLYLVKDFLDWHKSRTDVLLVIIGPKCDDDYQKQFLQEISKLSGIVYIPGLKPGDTHAAIRESFALVNTSDSEGMAAVILEAMQMGVPVLARDNEGNKSLIEDGVNGFLFNSPKVFLEKAKQLLETDDLKTSIVKTASTCVEKQHSATVEKDMYIKLLKDIEMDREKT